MTTFAESLYGRFAVTTEYYETFEQIPQNEVVLINDLEALGPDHGYQTLIISDGEMSHIPRNFRIEPGFLVEPGFRSIIFNTPKVEIIGTKFMIACYSLESVSLSENLILIEDEFLVDCINLKNLKLPENLSTIGSFFLFGCKSLKSLMFSESLRTVGSFFLASCSDLPPLKIPDGLTYVGPYFLHGSSCETSSTPPLHLDCRIERDFEHVRSL